MIPEKKPKLNIGIGERTLVVNEWDEDLFDVIEVTRVVAENLTEEEALELCAEILGDDDEEDLDAE